MSTPATYARKQWQPTAGQSQSVVVSKIAGVIDGLFRRLQTREYDRRVRPRSAYKRAGGVAVSAGEQAYRVRKR